MDRIYRKKEVDIWSEALYEGGRGTSKHFEPKNWFKAFYNR
jgi:hypothetical protein